MALEAGCGRPGCSHPLLFPWRPAAELAQPRPLCPACPGLRSGRPFWPGHGRGWLVETDDLRLRTLAAAPLPPRLHHFVGHAASCRAERRGPAAFAVLPQLVGA